MYDSIEPYAIPVNAGVVAGYVDGPLSTWPKAGWDRFPQARKVRICTWGPRNNGDCLDIEWGDSIPEDARPWALNRLNAGVEEPILYMSLGDFPLVRSFTQDLPVQYWVAHYTNIPHIPSGADACQWSSSPRITGGGYDLSICQPWFARKRTV